MYLGPLHGPRRETCIVICVCTRLFRSLREFYVRGDAMRTQRVLPKYYFTRVLRLAPQPHNHASCNVAVRLACIEIAPILPRQEPNVVLASRIRIRQTTPILFFTQSTRANRESVRTPHVCSRGAFSYKV